MRVVWQLAHTQVERWSSLQITGSRVWLSLLKNMFGLGSGRPTMASGNSLSGEYSLGRGCHRAIVVGVWVPLHSSGAFVERNKPRRRPAYLVRPRQEVKPRDARSDDADRRPAGTR